MIRKSAILLSFLLYLNSCLSFKKNNDYAKDFKMMGKNEFSKKYYTLYSENKNQFLNINTNEAYFIGRNGSTFQIIVFSNDSFIYETPLIPLSMFEKSFPPIKLSRSSYFRISNNLIKLESIASTPGNIYSIIEEGQMVKDTIFMKRQYKAKGVKNEHKLFEQYTLMPQVKVYIISGDYFVERQMKK